MSGEYAQYTQYQTSHQPSYSSTATFVQTDNANACLTTSRPWVIDYGASDHMTSTYSNLYSFQKASTHFGVALADGSIVHVKGINTVPYFP